VLLRLVPKSLTATSSIPGENGITTKGKLVNLCDKLLSVI
jgi:hypothetical protein